jgi:Prolyl 4-Hydroxylase alpha-subunit, N-terminal region
LLIKRLTKDWNEIEELLTGNPEVIQALIEVKGENKFPGPQDLQGAAVALTRLQDVYRLQTSDVSLGILNGVNYG